MSEGKTSKWEDFAALLTIAVVGFGVVSLAVAGWRFISDLDVSDFIDECVLAEDTAAQLVERQQRSLFALVFGAAGAQAAESLTSTPTMSQTALVRENPDGSLVCSSVASIYNVGTNEVKTEEVRYVVSDRADGGLGFHVQLLRKHQWED